MGRKAIFGPNRSESTAKSEYLDSPQRVDVDPTNGLVEP
jgi:hypothetical protein